MTKETCPICNGDKVALPPSLYNDIRWIGIEDKIETCWWCGGKGEVLKEATSNIHLNKYWMIKEEPIPKGNMKITEE